MHPFQGSRERWPGASGCRLRLVGFAVGAMKGPGGLVGSAALRHAVVLQDGEGPAATVALGEGTVVFGRRQPPHTDVQILDPLAAKLHFEIRWNAQTASHEISDLKATFPRDHQR